MDKYTPKQVVRLADPTAHCDFYESLRGSGRPCWFIRSGWQGPKRSAICASPRLAWRDAAERFFQQFPRLRKVA